MAEEIEFTQEEIAILKNVATAFSNATTIGGLTEIAMSSVADDLTIEVLENNASRRANLGTLLRKSFVPNEVNEKEVEEEIGAAYIIVYDKDGKARLITIEDLAGQMKNNGNKE